MTTNNPVPNDRTGVSVINENSNILSNPDYDKSDESQSMSLENVNVNTNIDIMNAIDYEESVTNENSNSLSNHGDYDQFEVSPLTYTKKVNVNTSYY